MHSRATRILAALAIVSTLAAAAAALSKEDVYYGNVRKYARVAEVNARKVFLAIPAYKEIVEKNIEKDSAIYLIKLTEANKVFCDILKTYAESNKYDLICEEGKVEGAHNATDEIVDILKGRSKK